MNLAALSGAVRPVFLFLLLGLVAGPAVAQSSTFLGRLCDLLAEKGWTTEDLARLRSQPADWDQARSSEARTVAEALLFTRSTAPELTPEVLASLAVNLAASVREMKRFGIDDQTATGLTIQIVRDVRDTLRRGGPGPVGDVVRASGERLGVPGRTTDLPGRGGPGQPGGGPVPGTEPRPRPGSGTGPSGGGRR